MNASRLTNILLSGIVLLITLVLLDRIIQTLYPVPMHRAWAGFPGNEVELVSEPDNFRATHRYNKYGFRGADFPIEPQSDVRIVAVGDSYTEGIGAQEDETWPSVLAKNLSPKKWEVINLGDGGANLERYAEIIAQAAVPLKPTDIVLCVLADDLRYGPDISRYLSVRTELGNHFKDNRKPFVKPIVSLLPGWYYLLDRARGRWSHRQGLYWRPYEEEYGRELAAQNLAWRKRMSPLKARRLVKENESMIANHVIEASKRGMFSGGLIHIVLASPYHLYLITSEHLEVDEEDLKESTYWWIRWYAETCEEYSIRPWLLYFPTAPLICEGPWGPLEDRYYEDAPRVLGDTSVAELLEGACDVYRVRFIDATPVLRDHSDEKLYHRWDAHPTALAYELVGQLVADSMTTIAASNGRSSKKP